MSDSSERNQLSAVAAGAGALAIVAALMTRRTPRWLRVTLVLGLVVLASGAGLLAYRQAAQPVVLTVAAGSLDGEAPKLMSAIATKLASTNSPVRLKVVEKAGAAEAAQAVSSGETNLAVVRTDVGDLSSARAVMIVAHAVVLIIAPPGSAATDMDDLKGKTIGVVGAGVNQKIVSVITREYDLERAKTRFRELLPNDVPAAIQAKQVQALLLVIPVSEKYIARIRELLPRNAKSKVALIPIESAGAIAALSKAYESYELPKGTLRGSPAVPDEDLTTLRLPLYLVANKTVGDTAVTALAKAVFDARRDLMAEYPLLAQIAEPDKDKDAYIPMHPGAAAYFDGEEKSFFDKYGDQLFYGSMLLGMLTSVLAGVWKFMARGADNVPDRPLSRLLALMDQIRSARSEDDLVQAEQRIDDIVRAQLEKTAPGEIDPGETAAVSLATHRLEHLLAQRRVILRNGVPVPAAS